MSEFLHYSGRQIATGSKKEQYDQVGIQPNYLRGGLKLMLRPLKVL